MLYNTQYEDASIKYIAAAVAAGTCTEEEGMLSFESKANQEMHLLFLKSFIQKQMSLYNMTLEASSTAPTKTKVAKNRENLPAAHLVNQAEKWVCVLCSTPHKSERGVSRRFYFHDTCEVFRSWDATRKSDFINKQKLCRICSCKLNSPMHKKPCDKIARFQCKLCLKNNEPEKAATHQTELHKGAPAKKAPVKQASPVNNQLCLNLLEPLHL